MKPPTALARRDPPAFGSPAGSASRRQGQYDRFGPASQREQQDRFIERHGLIDTGLVYQVAHSAARPSGARQR